MMRVLHMPTTVGGSSSGLSRQLKLLGIDSHVWAIGQNYLDYPLDRVLAEESDRPLVRLLKILWAGRYVFGRWDVIHFNYGSTLFSTWHSVSSRKGIAALPTTLLNGIAAVMQRVEVAVLRARRIPFFVHYQGDDARQGDYSREHFEISIATQVPLDYYTPESDEWKRRQIEFMTKRASTVYAVNPDLLHVLPPSTVFLPYGHIALEEWEPRYTQASREKLVFAHAPSHREVKGTDLILDAFTQLAAEGYLFDVELIEGVSNAEAIARYAESDILIDQLYAGWYGGVALEAMALGKPVVAYIREPDLCFIPQEMADELPLFQASPSTITSVLRAILETPRDDLVARARQSRAFVEKWHDPVAIASRVADDYRRGRKSLGRGARL